MMKPTDLDYSQYWKDELSTYNLQLIPIFIYLTILGLILQSVSNYMIMPHLWLTFAYAQIVLALFGILLIQLFKKGRIAAFWAENLFILALYLLGAYGAALINTPSTLLIWNLTLTLGLVFWPVLILIRQHKHCLITNLIFATFYLSFYELYSPLSLIDMLHQGGLFLFFSLLVSPYIAFSRYRIYSDNAFLKHQLEAYETYDSLTGLYNRRIGITHLEKEMQQARRHKYALSIIYIDLDQLKRVNDSFGHEAGDKLITTIADQLQKGIRKSDIACRMSGDEFLIILHECDDDSARRIMASIESNLEQLNASGEYPYVLRFSWGIAEFPDQNGPSITFNEFLRNAENAMQENKLQRRGHPISPQNIAP